MNFSDLISPLKRNHIINLIVFTLLFIAVLLGTKLIPTVQKTSIYYTVKPINTERESTSLDAAESAMKFAETTAGWAKDPAFRNEILDKAGISIVKFKKKITAKKQNRMNVFWTIKLNEDEVKNQEKVLKGFLASLAGRLEDFNNNNLYPYEITTPKIASETRSIPTSWSLIGALFIAIAGAVIIGYIKEMLLNKASFVFQVQQIFPESSILHIEGKAENHDAELFEQFIKSFKEKPILIGTFEASFQIFKTQNNIDCWDCQTPILLVRLGETSITELQNLEAIHGEEVGIIVFDA